MLPTKSGAAIRRRKRSADCWCTRRNLPAESEAHSHVSLELALAVEKYETTFDYTPAPLE